MVERSDQTIPEGTTTRRSALFAFLASAVPFDLGRGGERAIASTTEGTPEQPAAKAPAQAAAIHTHAQVTRLSRYGFKGNGSALDTRAWRDAIAEASERDINEVIVPAGNSIVDGNLLSEVGGRLPAGLTFRGEGRNQDSEYLSRNALIYIGSGTCWDVKYATGGPENSGRWRWKDLSFRATDAAATMFSFNDPLTNAPTDDDPYQFLMRIAFEQCFAAGANGTEGNFVGQKGDFIRASKVFHLSIDALSTIFGWRRGVWLHGCDNCQIDARFVSNIRAVMNQMANGYFANENRIAPFAILGLPNEAEASESSYSIWDDGRDTTVGGALLFEGKGAVAHMYLNGTRTRIERPVFGTGARLFHLGPKARNVSMFSPDVPVPNLDWAPLIDAPVDNAFGGEQTDYRMRIHDAPLNAQLVLHAAPDRHGRIQVVASPMHGLGFPAGDEVGVATSRGFLVPIVCTAANYWGQGGVGGHPIEGIVPDAGATGGNAIKLTKRAGSGFGLHFTIGQRVMPAHYTVSIRNRLAAGPAGSLLLFVATRNGKYVKSFSVNTSIAYSRPAPDPLDLTGFNIGDTLTLQLYSEGAGLEAWIDYIALTPVAD